MLRQGRGDIPELKPMLSQKLPALATP